MKLQTPRNALALLMALLFQANFSKAQSITVDLTVIDKSYEGAKLKLYREWPSRKLIDSLHIESSKSNYNLAVSRDDYGIYTLQKDRSTIDSPFVLDREHIEVSLNSNQLHLKGSPTQDLLYSYQQQNAILEDRWRENGEQYSKTENLDEKVKLGEQNKQIVEALLALNIKTIRDNKDNILGSYIASKYMYLWPKRELQQLEQILSTADNRYTQFVYPIIKNKLEELNNLSMVGKKMPDLAFRNSQNEVISLSSIIHNHDYTLVDFWASWCAPCRATNRQIETIYSALTKKGIEVVSISFDTNHDDWQKAVDNDKVSWLQLIDPTAFKGNSATALNIKSLPSTFLVDKSGNIINEQLHYEDLKKLLDK